MFTIITPTYKRSGEAMRAITSVCNQTNANFRMIVINDSPEDTTYEDVKNFCNTDSRITYVVNQENMGVNFSRNRGLLLADEQSWIIFLDDDDYLAPDALAHFAHLIETHPRKYWFMTNRVLSDGTPITRAPRAHATYSYAWDYLITKKITGDATHCIHKKILTTATFSKYIKQGEEWIFFYQLGLAENIFYVNHTSTISDGYGTLNFRARSRRELFSSWRALMREGAEKNLLVYPSFLLYMSARLLLLLIK